MEVGVGYTLGKHHLRVLEGDVLVRLTSQVTLETRSAPIRPGRALALCLQTFGKSGQQKMKKHRPTLARMSISTQHPESLKPIRSTAATAQTKMRIPYTVSSHAKPSAHRNCEHIPFHSL